MKQPHVDTYQAPTYRRLRGYAFDPSFNATIDKRQTNEVIYKVRWEDTEPGPVGEYLEIIDYDPTRQQFYDAIDLEDRYVLADYGLPLSEGDPRFHQQQVYAVAMSVIAQFEKALGRPIIWSRLTEKGKPGEQEYQHEFVQRLRIYPHALRQQNAFYSPGKVALLFGYFQASGQGKRNNVPGSAVFTCLSPDIVAHEITHAILDTVHPYLRNDTHPDMPAFHEGFADMIALLQRFTFASVVEDQIKNSKGDLLSPQNLLGDLAIQFGQAISSHRRALRSFLVENDKDGKPKMIEPDQSKYHTVTEPHERGGLLVAAVFDAFVRLYKFRVADLIRLATNGSGILGQGEIDPDLVKRLAKEACEIAEKLMLICIRALDYCPPLDLNYGDYLRSLVTADVEHNPEDQDGLRYALLESFRSWGIVPSDVNSYSVESLQWKTIDDSDDGRLTEALKKSIHYIFRNPANADDEPYDHANLSVETILRENSRRTIFEQTQVLSRYIHNIFGSNFKHYTHGLEGLLGMNFEEITYQWEDEQFGNIELKAPRRDATRNIFQVYKCRPLIRHNQQNGKVSKLMIITLLQKVYVQLKGSPYEGLFKDDLYDFRGGATLIVDLSNYEIKYSIRKSITASARLREQLQYAMTHSGDLAVADLLMQRDEPFAALHIH